MAGIKKIKECVQCLEDHVDSQVLKCRHPICMTCVNTLKRDSRVECPTCRTVSQVNLPSGELSYEEFTDFVVDPEPEVYRPPRRLEPIVRNDEPTPQEEEPEPQETPPVKPKSKLLLSPLAGTSLTLLEKVHLSTDPNSVRIIKDQVWVCLGGEGIAIFDKALQKVKDIAAGSMQFVSDVVEMANGEVIVGAKAGLFHMGSNGEMPKKVSPEEHTSVDISGDRLYVSESHKNQNTRKQQTAIVVYEYASNTWKKCHSFKLRETATTNRVTISVSKDTIYVCESSGRDANLYTLTGKHIKSTYEVDANYQKLHSPFLCATDDKGAMLIAGAKSHFTLIKGSTWKKISVPTWMKYPGCAAIDGDVMYIGSYQTLSKHSCQASSCCVIL